MLRWIWDFRPIFCWTCSIGMNVFIASLAGSMQKLERDVLFIRYDMSSSLGVFV